MSRVEENKTAVNTVNSSIGRISGETMVALMANNPGLVDNIIGTAELDLLVDISKSLAMIADDLHYYRQYESEVIERG